MKNLDQLAAEAAQEIIRGAKEVRYTVKENGRDVSKKIEASEVDGLITKALGIVQENGVYASLLYLYSRSRAVDNAVAEKTRVKLLKLIDQILELQLKSYAADKALEFLTEKICDDLDKLLLVKQLWEQTLIYTRYSAKAWNVEDEVKKAKEKEDAEKAKQAGEETEKVKSET